ncbi:OsmC family protein [Quadrisphaera setariae]|uniref:Osmotically inducible protein OsmC n=1 Tax=Quadrisphaera setariae TaxID=2593304 RepID=A0A5C8Z663_9ACTN|nr:OsmC family protein [Quadrisphaera setariae]TXR52678.1 hypothetical protein FMM08_18150 [Quadrisphaera setariae]
MSETAHSAHDSQTVQDATATAVAGSVKTSDGVLEAQTQLAGEAAGDRTTPEHLMAAATAACLQQSIGIAASTQDVDASGAQVTAHVVLTTAEEAGYTSHITLEVSGLADDVAERVLEQAQQICPFTKALAGSDLTVKLAA